MGTKTDWKQTQKIPDVLFVKDKDNLWDRNALILFMIRKVYNFYKIRLEKWNKFILNNIK